MPSLSHIHTKENNVMACAAELDFIRGEKDAWALHSLTTDTSNSMLIKPNDHPQ